jgi:predicted ester cyclase
MTQASEPGPSLRLIMDMEMALAANSDEMERFFHEDFVWWGNYGCGTKRGIDEFRRKWQLPLRAAFTERNYITERFIEQGEWVSCFGHIMGTHSGNFMGILPTGKRVRIPYMDFWRIENGRIAENWVSVDLPLVLRQLGRDVFDGHGWD